MEKKDMIEKIKSNVKKYGQCMQWQVCVETMARTSKTFGKDKDFEFYDKQVKDMEKALSGMLSAIEKMLDSIAERK